LTKIGDGVSTHDFILAEGYKLIDDAWVKDGRRTYIHDDDASAIEFKRLTAILGRVGWEIDTNRLRSLRHPASCDMIELESGGPDTTGHFLHHMKEFD
jgi:hypothetical protein